MRGFAESGWELHPSRHAGAAWLGMTDSRGREKSLVGADFNNHFGKCVILRAYYTGLETFHHTLLLIALCFQVNWALYSLSLIVKPFTGGWWFQTAPSGETHDKRPHPALARIVMTIPAAFDLLVEIEIMNWTHTERASVHVIKTRRLTPNCKEWCSVTRLGK